MKLPAVALASCFAGGIALGLWFPEVHTVRSAGALRLMIGGAALLILISFVLLRCGILFASAALSLAAWVVIGVAGAALAEQPLPADCVLHVVQEKHIDLRVPLRWQVQVKDAPLRMPWGWRYELALRSVEFQGETLPISGGLRLSYAPQPADGPPPVLHAGDTFSVLAQARFPQTYRDAGAFDRRAYLTEQGIDVVAALRAPELIEDVQRGTPTLNNRLIRFRSKLRYELDALAGGSPREAGVLRAMLLGDRSFVDRPESMDFQKTGVFHVLVVAGLHVAAFAAFLFWAGRRLHLSVVNTSVLILIALAVYVAVVEQRPPVLRAALMATLVVVASCFFRKLELLNSAALAALILLVADPLQLRDSSFQLSFLAMGCIGGLAIPWLDRTVQPYTKALRGWVDVTRDAAYEPRLAQFRIDLRSVASWFSSAVPARLERFAAGAIPQALVFAFRFWELFLLTIVLQVGMLPMLASDFHRVTLSGPVVNLFAVPLTGLIVPIGFLALLAGMVWHPLGAIMALPLRWTTALLLVSVHGFAHFSRWSYRIPGPPTWIVLLFFGSAVLLAACLRQQSRLPRLALLASTVSLATCAAVIAACPFAPKWMPGRLELDVLDVGQGDSLFLVSPKGRTLLIDGGGAFAGFSGAPMHNAPDPGEEAVSPFLWSRGFKRLDVVALTHAHQDHAGGLLAILENFRVGQLWIGRQVPAPVLEKLEAEAKGQGIPIVRQSRGRPFDWDGAELQFLWPENSSEPDRASANNEDSLVLHVRYGARSMLLTGDAGRDSEREMLGENRPEALRADVLKIGHHGSTNATIAEFLAEVHPQIGIISVGEDNPYGQPSANLLRRLGEARVRILRTDHAGAVRVTTDGSALNVSCFVACPQPFRTVSVQGPFPQSQQHGDQQ